MKTTARSLDFLTGLLVVLFAIFMVFQFALPSVESASQFIPSVYAQK